MARSRRTPWRGWMARGPTDNQVNRRGKAEGDFCEVCQHKVKARKFAGEWFLCCVCYSRDMEDFRLISLLEWERTRGCISARV